MLNFLTQTASYSKTIRDIRVFFFVAAFVFVFAMNWATVYSCDQIRGRPCDPTIRLYCGGNLCSFS